MADITKRFTGNANAGGELKDVRLRRTPRKPNEPQGTSTNAPPSTTATKTAGNNATATITANFTRPVSTTPPASKPSPATTSPSATTTKPDLKPVTTNATVNSNRPTMTSTETSVKSAPAATAPPISPTPSSHRPDNVSNDAEQSMRKTEFYEEEVQHFAEVDVKSFSIPQRPSQQSADRVEPDDLRCRSKPQSAPKPTERSPKSSSVNVIFVLLTAVLAAAIGWLGYEEILPAVYVVPGISISVGLLVMLLVWSALH